MVVVLGAPGCVLDLPVLWTQEVSDQISGAGQMLLEGGEKSQREENPKGENAFWNDAVYNCNNSPSRWFLQQGVKQQIGDREEGELQTSAAPNHCSSVPQSQCLRHCYLNNSRQGE